MNLIRKLAVVIVALGTVSAAQADLVSNWPPSGSISCVGEGCGPAYVGQTFSALDGYLDSVTFGFEYNVGADNFFRVLLATTTSLDTHISGADVPLEVRPEQLLFASDMLTLPGDSSDNVFNVDFGGIDLVDGEEYALIIDTFAYFDGTYSQGAPYWGADTGQTDGVSFAFAFVSVSDLSGTNISDHFLLDPSLGVSAGGDLAFEMYFDTSRDDLANPKLSFVAMPDPTIGGGTVSVPEPGTLALLTLGLVGIGIARRRRISK